MSLVKWAWFATIATGMFLSISASAQTEIVRFYNNDGPFSIELLSSDLEQTTLRLRIHSFGMTPMQIDGAEYSDIQVEGASFIEEKAWPRLPKIHQNILIPWSADELHFAVLSSKSKKFEIAPPVPSKGTILRSENPDKVAYSFADIYQWPQLDKPYPQNSLSLSPSFQLRGMRGTTIKFHPFQVSEDLTQLKVNYEMIVQVKHPSQMDAQKVNRHASLTRPFQSIVENTFLNSKEFLFSDAKAPPRDKGEILYISHPSLASGLEPLKQWKQQLGHSVYSVTLNETGYDYLSIKNYIQRYYNKNQSLSYVILIGDAEFVNFYPGTVGNAVGEEADPMYGLVVGDDSYPELIISRLSVKNLDELANIVSRSIRYEKYPEWGASWYSKALSIASMEGYPTDYERANDLNHILVRAQYKEIDTAYEPTARQTDVERSINSGLSLINYIGHGTESQWVTSSFYNSHVDLLRNTNRLPLIVSVACLNGAFAEPFTDVFAERWLKGGISQFPNGAIAIFASSTNQSWVPPTVGQKEIVRLIAENKDSTIGSLLLSGSIAVLEDASDTAEQTFQTWHIFGDPTVSLRTSPPKTIHIQDLKQQGGSIRLNVMEKQIDASITRDGTLISSTISDELGWIQFADFDANATHLTLSGPNMVPKIIDLKVNVEE